MVDIEKMDSRTQHRYLQKGLVLRKDVDAYEAALPDVAGNAEFIDYDKLFREQLEMERAEGNVSDGPRNGVTPLRRETGASSSAIMHAAAMSSSSPSTASGQSAAPGPASSDEEDDEEDASDEDELADGDDSEL